MPIDLPDENKRLALIGALIDRYRESKQRRLLQWAIELWRDEEAEPQVKEQL